MYCTLNATTNLVSRQFERKKLVLEHVYIEVLCNPQLASSASDIGFVLAVTLEEGLSRTLCYGFMENNWNNRIFETESLT